MGRQPSLPPLYPGPPGWLNDPAAFVRSLNIPFADITTDFLQSYIDQRELDDRWRLLAFLKEDKEECMTFEQYVRLYASAGWDLGSVRPRHINAEKKLSFGDLVQLGIHMPQLLPRHRRPALPLRLPPRQCDSCKSVTVKECICGESFCSVECQRKEWSSHRRLCEMVEENNSTAFLITKQYWKTRGF